MKRQSFWSILFLAVVLLVLYLPIVTVVAYSFNANPGRSPVEFTGFTTRWYRDLFSGTRGYGEALWMSVKVALWSTALSVVIGTLGAIGMAQRSLLPGAKPSRSAGLMETLVSLPIMIPEIILGMAFMAIFYGAGLPYIFLTVKGQLVGMDPALFDAARDLGATPRRVLVDITLPLVRPAIISGAFLAMAMSLDDFIISFFLYGSGSVTLPVKIYSSVRVGVSAQINALCSVMIAVAFLAISLSQYLNAIREARQKRKALRRTQPRLRMQTPNH